MSGANRANHRDWPQARSPHSVIQPRASDWTFRDAKESGVDSVRAPCPTDSKHRSKLRSLAPAILPAVTRRSRSIGCHAINSNMSRGRQYLQQTTLGAIFRVVSAIAGFSSFPLIVQHLGAAASGIWLTMMGILSWVVQFDLGLGNGLRNRVGECLARGEYNKARVLVSTAYTAFLPVVVGLWLISVGVLWFIDWQGVVNSREVSKEELWLASMVAISSLLTNFWLGLLYGVLGAIQRTAAGGFVQMAASVTTLIGVFYFFKTNTGGIVELTILTGGSTTLALVATTIWTFSRRAELRPRLQIEKTVLRSLLSVGFQFLVLQMSAIIMSGTDRLIVAQLFGAERVAEYEAVFKLFSVVTIANAILLIPAWSLFTDAYVQKDFTWIQRMMRRQFTLLLVLATFAGAIALFHRPIFDVWMKGTVVPSAGLVVAMCVYVTISSVSTLLSTLMNGIGEVKFQLRWAVFGMIVNIPLSILIAYHFGLGPAGVTVATTLCIVPGAIAAYGHLRRRGLVGSAPAR
jgi:O-antigen/teichoic acid export membrane protein